ncbi:hypothetical protein HanPI659440_Chr07g0255721 [Helianthus annuus]|nr:hypothetical protein HanPI659440_Chr07g0255721 [Helianthus annuus]
MRWKLRRVRMFVGLEMKLRFLRIYKYIMWQMIWQLRASKDAFSIGDSLSDKAVIGRWQSSSTCPSG